MDVYTATAPTMRSPDRWLAIFRIAVGLWFVKAIWQKLSVTLAWGFLPIPTASDRWLHVMPTLVTRYAEGNPVGFVKEFMLNTVVPNSHVYAQLTAFGEAAVGLGLVLGCLTTLASGVGIFLVLNYGLAVQWQGPGQRGFHYLLLVSFVIILAARGGRTWGVDGWVRAKRPGSWLARLPLG
jgi:thiosulfate dehydrogenase (quinone) large subunit